MRDTFAIYRGLRVLVTGHTGFKGAWLSLWLTELGAEVIGLSDAVPTEPSLFELAGLPGLVQDHRLDIRDAAGVQELIRRTQPDLVFHLAAQPIVRLALGDPLGTFAVNVLGTAAVLEAARHVPGVRAVVVVTSDKVYRNQLHAAPYDEDAPLGGHEPYGASKAAAEMVADVYKHPEFYRSTASPNVPAVATARAGNVIGGGDWAPNRLLPDIVRSITNGESLILRYPDAIRPWQHVLEPLSGYLTLASALMKGRQDVPLAVNFGPSDPTPLTVHEVVRLFLQAWGAPDHPVRIEPDPSAVETGVLQVSSHCAEAALEWRAVWDARRAVTETARWYRCWVDGSRNLQSVSRALIDAYTADAVDRNPSRHSARTGAARPLRVGAMP